MQLHFVMFMVSENQPSLVKYFDEAQENGNHQDLNFVLPEDLPLVSKKDLDD